MNVLEIINIRGKDVEIDELCIPLVEFFNSVKLHTKFCCEGHKDSENFHIMFEDCVGDDAIIEFIESYSNKYDHTPFLGRFYKWYRKMSGKIVSNWMYVAEDRNRAKVDYERMTGSEFNSK